MIGADGVQDDQQDVRGLAHRGGSRIGRRRGEGTNRAPSPGQTSMARMHHQQREPAADQPSQPSQPRLDPPGRPVCDAGGQQRARHRMESGHQQELAAQARNKKPRQDPSRRQPPCPAGIPGPAGGPNSRRSPGRRRAPSRRNACSSGKSPSRTTCTRTTSNTSSSRPAASPNQAAINRMDSGSFHAVVLRAWVAGSMVAAGTPDRCASLGRSLWIAPHREIGSRDPPQGKSRRFDSMGRASVPAGQVARLSGCTSRLRNPLSSRLTSQTIA